MPTRWTTFPIKFEGGLTTNLGRLEQGISAPGSATVLQNFEPDVRGGYTRILGYEKYSTTAVPGTGQIYGVVALSATEALVARGNDYQYSTGTTWTAKVALTNPAITRIRNASYDFNGTRYTVITDSVNPPVYFNHTTKGMAYVAGAPSDVVGAQRVAVFKNHVFFSKNNILSFSSPFTGDDFNPANGAGSINIGDEITGITVFRDQLIVFCLNKISRISGNSEADFTLSPITSNTGCLCGDTVQETGGDIMYLGPDGVRYLSASERNNDFGLSRASEKIQKAILTVIQTDCVYSSVTIAEKNQYRLFYYIPTVATESSKGFLATNYSNQTTDGIAWSELKGFKVYGLSKYQARDQEIILFVSDTGFVYKMESGNSLDGANIEAIFETPYTPITDPRVRKTIYKHTLYVRLSGQALINGVIKFDYSQPLASRGSSFSTDSGSGSSVYGQLGVKYGQAVYGESSEEQFTHNTTGSGLVVAIKYTSTGQSEPFNLNFATLEYTTNERR